MNGKVWGAVLLGLGILSSGRGMAQTPSAPVPETSVTCEIFIAGGGLGGVAAAYDALQLGRQVCMTEITDWIGGQVSAQGVSALDERPLQRENDIFPRGYSEFRQRVRAEYGGDPNPGKCWVSVLCFSPQVGHRVIRQMLEPYLQSGQLQLFTETVVKDLELRNNQIRSVQAIRNIPKHAGVEPEQRGDLSSYLLDFYRLEPTEDWDKEILRFVPPVGRQSQTLPWVVIDATETGELLPLARVPYRLGTDGESRWEPSSKPYVDPYCTQGFTYTFVMERLPLPQLPVRPEFYDDPLHGPYYSYEHPRFSFPLIFTYRRILGQVPGFGEEAIRVGDQSMQNWTWGNDWRITGPEKNLILTDAQLQASGQLDPGGWMGGLRPEALLRGEQHAKGFFYWLVAGTTDFLLQQEDPTFQKDYYLRYGYLEGADSPMGSASGLSKYPYIRESRRIIGRPSKAYPQGFTIYESDITTRESDLNRGRPFIFYDSVGIGQYPIDFHDCLLPDFSLPPSNNKDSQAPTYPYQIPLRALIPQRVDNLLAGNKNIATSRIASGSYRVHPVEWAIGTAAGHTAHFALERDLIPAEIVQEPLLDLQLLPALQAQIQSLGNPIQFPGTTITATEWADPR
ncbi:FAD-dependent oxidoreductase [Thermostichus vulcanus]|uniref:FAD-dependent oxidoreductase n=1 Tax=Thermostichus vulcanus str. 'Rupite' TaxID=2813851 RepID=A0ABT0CCN8_THEVL|nr:FAD-dependent oxidoreductase [Thermostichus vulcanus]MCJ2543556.1 FAD-dependent oxidoreductase [Thermostichus vulcanus str. 'Rupite']